MIGGLTAYAAGVAALTLAEMRKSGWQVLLKPLMASAFLLTAILSGALATSYGVMMLCALAACALGDVLLLSRDETPFLLGMVAFGLGHILFAAAFWSIKAAPIGLLEIAAVLIVILVGLISFVRSGPPGLRGVAALYTILIAGVLGAALLTREPLLIGATLAFITSDAVVSRDRFETQARWHPLAITPLYFGAQVIFALNPALLY